MADTKADAVQSVANALREDDRIIQDLKLIACLFPISQL